MPTSADDDPRAYARRRDAPGSSGPGEPGYEGEATVGDEGGNAGPESYVDPSAPPEEAEAAVTPEIRRTWARADDPPQEG